MEKLRFAALVRVSTEGQERKGESLKTQRKQIERDVKKMGGTISRWYAGQEHSSPGDERKILDQLLEDCRKGLFDAVICCHHDRMGRDTFKLKKVQQVLRESKIRLFVGTTEFDLLDENDMLMLGIFGEISEFQSKRQAKDSMKNRIEIAERGEPATRVPVGRTFKNGKWGINPEVKERWENIARDFLEGMSFVDLGVKYKTGRSYVRETLLTRCGDTWEQRFHAPKLGFNNLVFPTKVPRLLPEETIEAIAARVQQNKTIFRKPLKNKYLLTRMLMCGHCGQALYGDTYVNGKRVYRHRIEKFSKGQKILIDCNHFRYVWADEIEEAVMTHLFTVFGDVIMIEKAAKAAMPNLDELNGLQSQLESNEKELKKIRTGKENLLSAVESGHLELDDITERMAKLKERERLLIAENATVKARIEKIPNAEKVSRKARLIKRVMTEIAHLPSHLKKMTFDQKRTFLQTIFTMPNVSEERPGVYLKRVNDDGKQSWLYTIKGNLNLMDRAGRLPMSRSEKQDLFKWHCEDELKTESSDLWVTHIL